MGRLPPGGPDRITRLTGQTLLDSTTTSGVGSLDLIAQVDPRLSTISAAFQLFRFTWLKILIQPQPVAVDVTIGFSPDIPNNTTLPTSHAQMFELPYVVRLTAGSTGYRWIEIPRQALLRRNATLWFETDASTASEQEKIQGIFYGFTAGTDGFIFELEYEVEFCNPLPGSLTFFRGFSDSPKTENGPDTDYGRHSTCGAAEGEYRRPDTDDCTRVGLVTMKPGNYASRANAHEEPGRLGRVPPLIRGQRKQITGGASPQTD